MKKIYQRGEMYYADLGHGVGSEQEGRRPVVIIQNDVGNKHSPTVIVAAITTKTPDKRMLPTHYEIGTEHGLRAPSLVLLEQLRTIDKQRLEKRIGSYKRGCYYNVNTPKTKASTRQVPMLDFVKEAFIMEREYQEAMGIKCEVTIDGYTDFVFVNRFGTPQNLANLNKAIHRIIRDCNDEEFLKDENPAVLLPNFSCHSLRHTFTTRMCEAGVNVKVIQDALGHQDISTTLNIYADVTKELKQKEFAGLDMYFTKDKKSMSPLDQQ